MGLCILITVNNKADENLTGMVSTVEVYEKMDQPTSYKIRFMVDICNQDIAKDLEKPTGPDSILGVLADVNDQLSCLVSGPVSKQEAYLEEGGSGSWLEVEGTDSSQLMDREVNIHNQKGKDSAIVSGILSPKYLRDTDVKTTDVEHSEDKHTVVQKETDLVFIKKLAQRNGFHFWITYDKDGNGTGHFKPRSLQGTPAADLFVNQLKPTIDNLQIKWDINRPTESKGSQVDQNTKKIIGGKVNLKDAETLGQDGIQKIAGNNPTTTKISPPVDDGASLDSRNKAVLDDAQWFISASCKTTTNRLCKLVRVHTIVNIQGLGTRHSGKYYVTGVKHTIDAAAHTMDIELERNAWGTESSVNGNKTLQF